MLQTIRDKTTGWIAVAIVTLLIIPFAFWGINYYFRGGKEPAVATVNGDDIKLSRFQRTYSNYRLQLQNLLGKPIGPDEEGLLKRQTLDKMVESEILNQVTRTAGLRVSNEQVKNTIKSIDVFKDGDGFNREYYQQSIMRLGMPPALYEEQMRLDMMSEQLQSAIVESEFVTDFEVDNALLMENQKRNLTYTIISTDRFKDSIEISDSDIQKFYNENSTLYINPEQVKISYIELNLDDLAAKAEVNDEELHAYYDENKTKYDKEEQRKVTQILIKADEKATDKEKEDARSEAEKILDQIHAGKTIQDIANDYADKTMENFSISEYGFLGKGILQPEVDEAVYSMNIGDISNVIESRLGFHIVKLEDIKGGEMNTFGNSREDVEKDYRYKKAEKSFFDLADQLATLTYEHPDTLEIAAEDTGLPVQESDLFGRGGTEEGITANPSVVATSFSEEVLASQHNSEVIELTDRNLVVLRVIEHIPQAKRPLDEIREEVIKDIKFTEAGKWAHAMGQQILQDIKSGKNLETIAEEKEITWNHANDITRNDVTVNRSILRTAFSLGIPEKGKPVYSGLTLGTGEYVVVTVTSVSEPDLESIKDKNREDLSIRLYSAYAEDDWEHYLDEIKSESELVYNREILE